MEEPGRLQSMGSLRVGHGWATSLSLFTLMHWRGNWQPTPVFLPGESQGQGSLVGCRPWGRTESDTTEATWQQQQQELQTDSKVMEKMWDFWESSCQLNPFFILEKDSSYMLILSPDIVPHKHWKCADNCQRSIFLQLTSRILSKVNKLFYHACP